MERKSYYEELKISIKYVRDDIFLRAFVFYPAAINLFFSSSYMVTVYSLKLVFKFSASLIGLSQSIFSAVYLLVPIIFSNWIKNQSTSRLLWSSTRYLSFAILGIGISIFLGVEAFIPLMAVYIY